MTRRELLRLLGAGAASAAGGLLAPGRARALGDPDRLTIAALEYPAGNWQPRPSALRRVLWEIDRRTSIDVKLEPTSVRLASPELLRHPFLYLAGDRAFPPPPEEDVARLRRHLQIGGFLVIDGADGHAGGPFDQSVRRLAQRLFPKEPLARLPDDHVLYKSFYLLRMAPGRVLAVPWLEAVVHDGRAAIVYCQNDLGGAWARDEFGQWEHEVFPGGEQQREAAFRVGVNLAMYATCTDYKTDQVHVPFILRRRKWQSR